MNARSIITLLIAIAMALGAVHTAFGDDGDPIEVTPPSNVHVIDPQRVPPPQFQFAPKLAELGLRSGATGKAGT